MTDRWFEAANARASAELRELVESLSAEALVADAGDGWTVAVLLAHLAFWDRWQIVRWQGARAEGLAMPADVSDNVADLANGALEATWRALPAATAAELAVAAAGEVDALVAGLSDASVDAVVAAGRARLLDRSLHRADHLAQIGRVLGRTEG